jgi:uncharacterized protein YecT (DUF1311 family)
LHVPLKRAPLAIPDCNRSVKAVSNRLNAPFPRGTDGAATFCSYSARMKRASLFVFLVLFAGAAAGASFDCAKAGTHVEKQVCADPGLSRLDEALGNEYRAAIARGDTSLKSEQQAWLKQVRNACHTAECLRQAYEARIDQLRGVAGFPDLAGAVIGSCTALAGRAGANPTDCRVVEKGSFGKLGEEVQAYALYCLDPGPKEEGRPCDTAGVALFSVEARTGKAQRWLTQVDVEGGGNVYMKPELLRAGAAQLLHLPVSVPGTGDFNASSLYRRDGSRWTEVDDTSWEKDLAAQLPKGLAVWKGIWPDWKRMHASTGLYRAKDANCCASGGRAEMELALHGNRIDLVSFKILPSKH